MDNNTLHSTIDFLLDKEMAFLLKNYPIKNDWPNDIKLKMNILTDTVNIFHKYPFISGLLFKNIDNKYDVRIGNDGLLVQNLEVEARMKEAEGTPNRGKIWMDWIKGRNPTFDELVIPTKNGMTSRNLIQKEISETFSYLNTSENATILNGNEINLYEILILNYIEMNFEASPDFSRQFKKFLGEEHIQFIKNFETFNHLNNSLPPKDIKQLKKI